MNASYIVYSIALAVTTFGPSRRTADVKPVDIHSGFVFVEGRYMPPPYIVQPERGRVRINGREVARIGLGPFYRRRTSVGRFSQSALSRAVARIEQHLRRDGMLIGTRSGPAAFVPAHEAISILDALLSNAPSDAKLQTLLQSGSSRLNSQQWASLIETFDAPAELSDRVSALKQHRVELAENNADHELCWAFLSGITIAGFVLAVLALGTLLSCRPPGIRDWRNKDQSRVPCRQVIWLVVLIVVLNIYDLTCTLFAHGVGGLWELNPFVGHAMEQTSMVVTFKIALTVSAALLLLATRCHRLAQIGSWWASVLYTVLILRWITFNSMML